jgi:cyclopropane-fatty-acyl-phospholipid synthase
LTDVAPRLAALAERLLEEPLPIRIRAWDGSTAGPPGAPVLRIRHRRALRRILWSPGELGLARAWVAGELDVDGDLYGLLAQLAPLLWEKNEDGGTRQRVAALVRDPDVRAAARELLSLGGPLPPPAPPREETRRRFGVRHTPGRDRQAVRHHYDVGNDFYELVLGPSMVYSCAYWEPGDEGRKPTLEEAQHAKLDLVCRKLALTPGSRLLDVGCGWGSLVQHAAREYGASAVGITLSHEQATYARKRVAEEGLADRVEIRVQDYRDVADGPYDAIASIGMAEHVGREHYLQYAGGLYSLLKPGGRLLNHQIARRPLRDESAYRVDDFIEAYVFPDGELAPLARTAGALEEAGFEVRDVESLREHYALTLRAWVDNLEGAFPRAAALTSPGRARVWRLYMAASALAFERNRIGVNQILAVRTPVSGESGLPLRTREWLGG